MIRAHFWPDQVPLSRNIADLPTEWADLPTSTTKTLPFSAVHIIEEWATKARRKNEFALFTNGPSAGKRETPRKRHFEP